MYGYFCTVVNTACVTKTNYCGTICSKSIIRWTPEAQKEMEESAKNCIQCSTVIVAEGPAATGITKLMLQIRLMALFHCRTRIPTWIRGEFHVGAITISNVHVTQIRIWIRIPMPSGYCTHFFRWISGPAVGVRLQQCKSAII